MPETTPPNFTGAAILLDRDGVINHDPGDYTKSLAEFRILPTALEAMKAWYSAGFKLIIITNQGGIAKGKYTHEAVAEIHAYLRTEAQSKGAPISDIFYSPHHPDYGQSLSRKPGSLMVERALARHKLDPKRCWMVGDKARDIDCALGAGVPNGILIAPNAPLLNWKEVPLLSQP
ncbi:MAG: HAD family hydrolase [Flavobacteriales bacterium]|nr:HAD family hydrolase [Flavobacteriales bacterium]